MESLTEYEDHQQRTKMPAHLITGLAILGLILAGVFCFVLLGHTASPVLERATLEAGHSVTPELFLRNAEKYRDFAVFKTEIYELDTSIPGEYPLVLTVKNRDYDTVLEILDRTAPTAEPAKCSTVPGVLPAPEALVTRIKDVSSVTVAYAAEPDVSRTGTVDAQVILTDAYGNTNVVQVSILVNNDQTPPVIEGATDLVYYLGETIDFKRGITVTDNETAAPELTVDISQVNLSSPGTYPVIYIAQDDSGNEATVTVQLTLRETSQEEISENVVLEMAQDILRDITTEVMTPMEVAFAIFRWSSNQISYIGTSNKSSWQQAAYDAFTLKAGDAFTYFAAAKALYTAAGIENIDVVCSDPTQPGHYWSLINLGQGWYHVDCTPRRDSGFFFMNTDAELEEYSLRNDSHIFDPDAYPERATTSVQSLVDYDTGKVFG